MGGICLRDMTDSFFAMCQLDEAQTCNARGDGNRPKQLQARRRVSCTRVSAPGDRSVAEVVGSRRSARRIGLRTLYLRCRADSRSRASRHGVRTRVGDRDPLDPNCELRQMDV